MKILLRLLLAFLLLFIFCTCVYSQNEPEWQMQNEDILTPYLRGEYDKAVAAAEKAVLEAEKNINTTVPVKNPKKMNAAGEIELKRKLEAKKKADNARLYVAYNCLARLYVFQAKYAQAEPLFKRTIDIKVKAFGADSENVIVDMNYLALLYDTMGKYNEAEVIYKNALEISGKDNPKKMFQDDQFDVVLLNNLAMLYDEQGQYYKSEPLYERAISILENISVETGFSTSQSYEAMILKNLAYSYDNHGKYSKSVPLYARSYAIMDGYLNPETIQSDGCGWICAGLLISNYSFQPIFYNILAIKDRPLNLENPEISANFNNVTAVCNLTKDPYLPIASVQQRKLMLMERTCGLDSLEVANCLNDQAITYQTAGLYTQSEALFQRALAIKEKTFGLNHPEIAEILTSLAFLYEKQTEYEKAEAAFKRTLEIQEKIFEPNQLVVAYSLNNLANFYVSRKKYKKAEPLYKRALTIMKPVLGLNNSFVSALLDNIFSINSKNYFSYATSKEFCIRMLDDSVLEYNAVAKLSKIKGNYTDALDEYSHTLSFDKTQNKPISVESMSCIAELLCINKEYNLAEDYYTRALAIMKKSTNFDSPETVACLNNLADFYTGQKKYEQAEKLYDRAMEIEKKIYPPIKMKNTMVMRDANPNDLKRIITLYKAASLYHLQGNIKKEEITYTTILDIYEKNEATEFMCRPRVLVHEKLADIYFTQGNLAKAEPLYIRALTLNETYYGTDHLFTAIVLYKLAATTTDKVKAKPLYKRAMAIIYNKMNMIIPYEKFINFLNRIKS